MSRAFLPGAIFAALTFVLSASPVAVSAAAADCPNNGVVRYGVEPFEATSKLTPVYDLVAKALEEKLGCKVELFIATNYNAEIEAMRNGKLEVAEFGPLGYVLAHQVAHAAVFATYTNAAGDGPSTYWASIVTHKDSGLKSLKDLAGHSFAFSDPASTSGHLFPAYALRKAGIDPDTGVKAVYAGSHTAAYEALRNKKVDAGELNSPTLIIAQKEGTWNGDDYVTLWKSQDIPNDPITVREDLTPAFKKKLADAFMSLDLHKIPDPSNVLKGLGYGFIAQKDTSYDQIRDLVKTLNVDLSKL